MSEHEWELIEGELSINDEAHILGDAQILGIDADTTSTITSALSELIKSGGSIAASKQQSDAQAAAAKKAKDAAALASKASAADLAAAQQAQLDAQLAHMKANSETDPNGPLHQAALVADTKAAQLAQKIGAIVGPQPAPAPAPSSGKSGGGLATRVGPMPLWGWLLTLAGLGGATFITVKMLGKKHR